MGEGSRFPAQRDFVCLHGEQLLNRDPQGLRCSCEWSPLRHKGGAGFLFSFPPIPMDAAMSKWGNYR